MVAQELLKNYWSSLPPESSVCAGIPREIPTSRPYVCGNKRREFLFASLFFPYFLSLLLIPTLTPALKNLGVESLKGSCQTRPQEQSLVGGMKCGQSGLHMTAHLEIVQICALLVKLTTDQWRLLVCSPWAERMEKLQNWSRICLILLSAASSSHQLFPGASRGNERRDICETD